MAVEIKELVIRAVAVSEPAQRGTDSQPTTLDQAHMQKLVKACVQEVLNILERKDAR